MTTNQQARIPIAEQPQRCYLDGARLVQADVADLTAADLRPPGVPRTWRPALVTGGPPCQPWSSAGLQRGHDDPRGQLFPHMVRLTDELAPRFVLFENVRGLVTAVGPSGRPGEALDLLKHSFEDLGYATTFATVNAADYGAAQRRVRLMMIATADHELPAFPEPTHAKVRGGDAPASAKPWVSLAELLAGLPEPDPADVVRPTARRAAELEALRPGTGIRTGGAVESNRPGGHWGYRQDCFVADPTLPSRTIRAASTPDWVRDRDGRLRR
nr:DNA cytosine methyltransferase [Micromonospora sp. DSM 115978]